MNGENPQEDMQKMQQLEQMKKQILSGMLTKESYERLGRVRAVNPELANQVEMYLIQVYQTGKVAGKIGDDKLKEILTVLTKKKDFRIKRV